jgi:hypothetical protein
MSKKTKSTKPWCGHDAAQWMAVAHIEGRRGVKGYCLKICRQAWKIPVKYPSAIVAWNNIPRKHKFIDPMKAPVGATHFWKGGKFGHVAIQSDKSGYVWSTDLPIKDRVGKIYYTEITKRWRFKYLGWTTQLNGVDLYVS